MKKKFLDSIEVKSPCNESWDEMFGNNEVRFCSHCAKNVHNISAMTRVNAEKLVKDSNGKLCVRYVKNPNGAIITAPTKLTQITRRATIAAGVLATSLTIATLTYAQGEPIVRKDNSAQSQKDKTQKDEIKEGFAIISGTIADASGSVVAGAKITLRDTKKRKNYLSQTNENGHYEFKNVESSVYELTIESAGFKKAVMQNIEVLKEAKLQTNFVLEVGGITMGVIVVADEVLELSKDADKIEQELTKIAESQIEKPIKLKKSKPKKKKN